MGKTHSPFGASSTTKTSQSRNSRNTELNERKVTLNNDVKFSLKYCITKTVAALIGGFIGYIICENLYENLLYSIWTPILVSLYLLILATSTTLPIAVISMIKDEPGKYRQYKKQLYKTNTNKFEEKKGSKSVVKYFITLLVLLLSTLLLEFIYEQNLSSVLTTPSSYIFALDMSSSMIDNDRDRQLEPAVQNVISQVDDNFPFAIYTFTETPSCIQPMNNKASDNSVRNWDFNYNGGTNIISALELIINDYHEQKSSGKWKGGNTPKVLLMTDGEFGNPNIDTLLNEFVKEGIVICTIGMRGCREGQLQEVAGKTGGIFIKVKDASRLDTSMRTAALYSANYNLLSERYGAKHDFLCKVLRIVFLTILGLFMIPLFYFANDIEDDSAAIVLIKSITALVSGVLLEIMLRKFSVSLITTHFFYYLLTSFVILQTVHTNIITPQFNRTPKKNIRKKKAFIDDRTGQRIK